MCLSTGFGSRGGRLNYETQPPRFWENPGTQNCPTISTHIQKNIAPPTGWGDCSDTHPPRSSFPVSLVTSCCFSSPPATSSPSFWAPLRDGCDLSSSSTSPAPPCLCCFFPILFLLAVVLVTGGGGVQGASTTGELLSQEPP